MTVEEKLLDIHNNSGIKFKDDRKEIIAALHATNIHNYYELILYIAASKGYTDLFRALVLDDLDIAIEDLHYNTLLHVAVLGGHLDIITYIITDSLIDINLENDDGNTALHLAVEENNFEIVKVLILHADLYKTNNNGIIPFHLAIMKSQTEIVEYFVKSGININYQNLVGNNSLHLAIIYQNEEMLESFIKCDVNLNRSNNFGYTALHLATFHQNTKMVDKLITAGANLDALSIKNGTALHMALETRNIEIISLLITKGADKNAKNHAGNTALHLAGINGSMEIVNLLIMAGSHIEVKNQMGDTILHFVASNNNIEIAKFLVKGRANKESKNYAGQSPLQIAIYNGNIEMIKYLLSSGVEKNTKDEFMNTALHIAASVGNREIVRLLLDEINQNSVNYEKNTALQIAILHNKIDTAFVLIEYGVNVNNINKFGESALFLAVRSGNIKVIEKLLSHGVNIEVNEFSSIEMWRVINDIVKNFYSEEIIEVKLAQVIKNQNFAHTKIIIQMIKGAILADSLYNYGQKSIKECLYYFNSDIFLSRLKYLYQEKGVISDIEFSILPQAMLEQLKEIVGLIQVSEEKIFEAIEVPLAEILHKLYPEDFPCKSPYSILEKYKDMERKYDYKHNLDSYERLPHFHPLNFFYYMISSHNRHRIVNIYTEMPEEMSMIIDALKKMPLCYNHKQELINLCEILNSNLTQIRTTKNLYHEIKMIRNIMQYQGDEIKKLQECVEKQQNLINWMKESLLQKEKNEDKIIILESNVGDKVNALSEITKRKFSESFIDQENMRRKDKVPKESVII